MRARDERVSVVREWRIRIIEVPQPLTGGVQYGAFVMLRTDLTLPIGAFTLKEITDAIAKAIADDIERERKS